MVTKEDHANLQINDRKNDIQYLGASRSCFRTFVERASLHVRLSKNYRDRTILMP